jgi:peptide/nickel transport system permease protein
MSADAQRRLRAASWRLWQRIRRSPGMLLGTLLLALHLVTALAAPLIAPHSPTAIAPERALAGPTPAHPFGNDRFGRDLLSRVMLGGRIAIAIGVTGGAIAVLLGGFVGVLVGYLGGLTDELVMRMVDALIAIPGLLLLLVIVTGLGNGYGVILLAMILSYAPGVARVARAAAHEYVPREFITAARARGEHPLAVVGHELWPNVVGVLFVEFAMRASWIVLAVSGLSFLGFGVNPPTPDWGLMIAENRSMLALAPWGVAFPLIAMATLVVALNLVADGLAQLLGVDRAMEAR